MKFSIRSLMRAFPKAKAAARKGQAVEIVDGNTGERVVLTAKPAKTFGEIAARAKGVYAGPRNLRCGKVSVAEFSLRPSRTP